MKEEEIIKELQKEIIDSFRKRLDEGFFLDDYNSANVFTGILNITNELK